MKLQRENEELRRALREQNVDTTTGTLRVLKQSVDPQPFTQEIMTEQVLPHCMVLEMAPYLTVGDLKAHLKLFRAQMIISKRSDAVQCKIFLGTFTRTTFQWFSGILYATIESFNTFL